MRITAEDRRAKLAKLIAIEGYSSIEELVQVVLSDSVSPRHLHECGLQLHLRDGTGSGCRLLRGMPHQLDAFGLDTRRTHLMRRARSSAPPLTCAGLFQLDQACG